VGDNGPLLLLATVCHQAVHEPLLVVGDGPLLVVGGVSVERAQAAHEALVVSSDQAAHKARKRREEALQAHLIRIATTGFAFSALPTSRVHIYHDMEARVFIFNAFTSRVENNTT
jgi:hypothetical protein